MISWKHFCGLAVFLVVLGGLPAWVLAAEEPAAGDYVPVTTENVIGVASGVNANTRSALARTLGKTLTKKNTR